MNSCSIYRVVLGAAFEVRSNIDSAEFSLLKIDQFSFGLKHLSNVYIYIQEGINYNTLALSKI